MRANFRTESMTMRAIAVPGVRADHERQRIIGFAAKAFFQQSYEATTVDDIAKEMGVTKGHVYYYFSSKPEILYTVCSQAIDELLKVMRTEISRRGRPEAKLTRVLAAHIEFIAEHPLLSRAMWTIRYGGFPTKYRRYLQQQGSQIRQIYVDLLAQIAGAHGKPRRADLPQMVHMIMGSVMWLPFWYLPERKGSPKTIARTLAQMAVFGS